MIRAIIDEAKIKEEAAYALVLHPTGVEYAVQCAGLRCDERVAEGFLIPLGGSSVAKPLTDWFWNVFEGHSYRPATEWGTDKMAQLQELVARILCWKSTPEGDEKHFLELDEKRLLECTEAWVPVRTPYGPGLLLFPNCD